MGGYNHPHHEVPICAYNIENHRLSNVLSHKFHCGNRIITEKENNEFKFEEKHENEFCTMETTYGFYNTTNHGNIIFKWKLDTDILEEPRFQQTK
jgi:hypothetical protein